MLLLPTAAWSATPSSVTVTLDYTQSYQTIEGFGTSITTWLPDVTAYYSSEDFARLYKEELGASALRLELYPRCAPLARERWQDISYRDFDFQGQGARGEITNRFVRRLHEVYGGALRVIATAWSPPTWMKLNGSVGNGHPQRKNFALSFDDPLERGAWNKPAESAAAIERYTYLGLNKLRPDRYLHFAKLLVEWCRHFRSLGIDLYAISAANEPRFSHWFESCVYTPEEYARLTETVAWVFSREQEPTKLFGPEHMAWDQPGNALYLDELTRRTGAIDALTAVASHGYIDGYASDLQRQSAKALSRLASRRGKRAWITEGGTGAHAWPMPLHHVAASFIYALRDGDVTLLMPWQSVTREPDEHGLMTLGGLTKKTYVVMHFWRFIRPGMVRIASRAAGQLDALAFHAPNSHESILVLLNRTTSPQPVSLKLIGKQLASIAAAYVTDATRNLAAATGANGARVAVPAESIVSLRLRTVEP